MMEEKVDQQQAGEISPGLQRALDRFKEHQTKAARAGGRVRSERKAAAARANLMKAREKRHRHEGTLTQTPQTPQDPSPQAQEPPEPNGPTQT